MMRRVLILVVLLMPVLGQAQQIYTCKDNQGRNTYQQVPCEKGTREHAARGYRPVADAPARYSAGRAHAPASTVQYTPAAQAGGGGALIQRDAGPSGAQGAFVRCVGADGSVRVRQGTSCPTRTRTIPHQAGMVTDLTTGQQHFMVPGGGNGMIDPRTGKRHELVSPPPTVRYQDRAESISGAEACEEAKARYQQVMSDFNRSINQMRAAEDRKRQFCGG